MMTHLSIFTRLRRCCLVPIVALTLAPSADASDVELSRRVVVMGTVLDLRVSARDRHTALAASKAIIDAVEGVESRLSTWREDSELSRFNRAAVGTPVKISPELEADLRSAHHWWSETGGIFDPGVASLVTAWDLRGGGRSPSPAELAAYADRLTVTASSPISTRIVAKPCFGLWVLNGDGARMIVDAGRIGPDYLPGHTHCDTLSYEMSIGGRRFAVNSGVFTYQGPERSWFRSTAAHNTVRIDGEEQHEIWSAFRVARRGFPVKIGSDDSREGLSFSAAHTGYRRLPGAPLHRRTIGYEDHVWSVDDRVEGNGTHRAESYIHLHPDVDVVQAEESSVECRLGDAVMSIHATGCDKMTVESGFYSPEFGLELENRVVVVTKEGALPFSFGYRLEHSRG